MSDVRRRLRVYSEDLPFDELVSAHVLGLLAARGVELIVAVRPWTLDGLSAVMDAARGHGIPVTVWPMLADHEGRWASVSTAGTFAAFARVVLERCAPSELLIDLEPPIARVRRLIDGALPLFGRTRGDAEPLRRLIAEMGVRGVRTTAAVIPLILADGRSGRFQRWLGTPVDGLPWSTVSTMAYTSLFEGYSRGTLRRSDARALLALIARHARRRFGARAGMSLGAVAVGALGDERPYRGPEELADDVEIVNAEGIDDLALFDLRGLLAQAPLDAWLDALGSTAATRAPMTRRVATSTALLRLAGLG